MHSFRPQRNEIPKHVRIAQMSRRISLLRMNKRWEEHGIPQEEDGGVVTHHVPVPLFGIKLDCKSSRIPRCIGTSRFAPDRTEAYRYGGLFTFGGEHVCLAYLRNEFIIRDLEVTECSRSFGVNDSFRDAFSVKVCNVVDECGILEDYGAGGSCGGGCREVVDG